MQPAAISRVTSDSASARGSKPNDLSIDACDAPSLLAVEMRMNPPARSRMKSSVAVMVHSIQTEKRNVARTVRKSPSGTNHFVPKIRSPASPSPGTMYP